MRRVALAAISFIIACVGVSSFSAVREAYAANVDVSVGVGDTTVIIQGSTSPLALVTFMDGTSVIGSTTANATGSFSRLFTSQTPGIHTYQVYAEDASGRITDTTTVSTNVQEHNQTTLTLFLVPTIEVTDSEVMQGEDITIRGATAPNANVIIYFDDTYIVVDADTAGNWSYTLNTDELEAGEHQFYVKAIKSGGAQSEASDIRTLIITARPDETPTPQPTLPPEKIQTPSITSPRSGTTISNGCVVLSGVAAAGTQIEVWNRGQLIGSAITGSNGRWSIKVCLSEFENDLKVRSCRGSVCSAFSRSIKIFRENPPHPESLRVTLSKYRLQTLVNDPISITVRISGGQGPYRLLVDWGDGQTTELSRSNTVQFLSHRYQRPGSYNGVVTVIDSRGERVSSAFSVVAKDKKSVAPSWASLLVAPAVVVASTAAFILVFPKPAIVGKRWILKGIQRIIR